MKIHTGAGPQTDAEGAVVGFLDAWGPVPARRCSTAATSE